jgi:trimeric autotransporter adhesin
MKQKLHLLVFLLALGFNSFVNAQVTGIKTIPGDYATIQAAIIDLNTVGVGAGGATFNIAAGYTETATAALVLTVATNTTSVSRPLVFQKSGTGANPLITAFTGTSTTLDGLFILNGVDYVTLNGIDLQENAANTTPTTQMEFGYALLKTTATNGCQNNTIKNCVVTLNKTNNATLGIYAANHTTVAITQLNLTSFAGTNSNNKFQNNTVQNCYGGYAINGFAAAAPYDFYDQRNEIGVDGVSANLSQVLDFGGGANATSGISVSNQNNVKIFNTTINSGTIINTGVLTGILLSGGTNANVDVYNNTVTVVNTSTGLGAMYGINNFSGATGAGNTVNIYGNTVSNCTYANNPSGQFRAISTSATATYTNINNNTVANNTIAGTAEFSGIYYSGSSQTLCLLVNINNNIINNNSKTGTAGVFNAIFANASTNTTNTFSNTITNNSNALSSGFTYGYYNFGFGLNENVYNNQIYNNAGGSGETVMLHARSGSAPTNKEVYGNTIYNITANTNSRFGAIWVDYGTIGNVYKNNIYNLTNNTTTGGTPAVFGIYIGNNVNTQITTHNNFISDLKAPNASNTNAIYGIWLQGTAASVLNAYHNTVYINATSTGANFGTAVIFCEQTPASIDLRNNILVNTSTPAGTGLTRLIARNGVSLTNYALTSGYNCVFAGTPSASNLIFSDGTNNDQTVQAFKNRVGAREQSSFSELPPFVNSTTAPFDLHLKNNVATQCEKGSKTIASISQDYDGDTRGALPDVGADEFAGITVDIASPDIQYTVLTNSSVAASRTLTAFATITDPSGVNTTTGTRPRLYYKKSTQANTYNDNTNATNGWKFVEASNATSPFNFIIDYTKLFTGSVLAADVIQYFVTAQDLNATPRIGLNNGGFTTQPASVNLTAANFPLNNTINQFTIVATPLSGTINVGPTETITSLTNAGGLFALMNAGVLSGNVTANITGDLTAETGTNALNQWAEEGIGNYTLTIRPSAGVTRLISGSNASKSLIQLDGADRVTIDGRFAGSGSFLTFRNTSAAPTIGFINDAQNNTLRNSIIESGNSISSGQLGGAILIGDTNIVNGNGNDNNTITNCEIRDRSDAVGTPAVGINCAGVAASATLTQYNNNVTISNNTIHDWFLLNSSGQIGLNIGTGNSGFTITGNSFYQTATRTHTVSGAITTGININFSSTVNSNGGHTITDNFIGGTAPGATGGNMTLTVSGVGVTQIFIGISVVSGLIPNSIQNNTIRNIDFTTNAPAAGTNMFIGMNFGQGIYNIGTVTGNTIGTANGNDAVKININTGGAFSSFLAGILASASNGYFNIQNNTIGGITVGGTTTAGAIIPQWIQVQGTPVQNSIISNNLIGSLTTPNSIQVTASSPTVISFGIRHLITSGVGATISNNAIQNVSDASTNAGSQDFGILLSSTVGSQGTLIVSNNTIKDYVINSAQAAPAFAVHGIAAQGYAGTTHDFSGNTISGLSNSNTGAFASYVVGIQTQGSTFGGTMNRNRIFDLKNANTGAAGLHGIYINAGLNWTLNNNRISIANGVGTNGLDVSGITDFMAQNSTLNLNYNSIYLGGTSAGTTNTMAYNHAGNATVALKNNLLYNERTGGTGNHVAIASSSAAPSLGWNDSNYNAFVTSDAAKIGLWGNTATNFATWKTSSGRDANSISATNTVVTSPALFVNTALGDLKINTSKFPEASGIPVAGITVDFDGDVRSLLTPTIGSDEVPCSPITASVTSKTNVTCNGLSNGSATINAVGGNGITFSWAPTGGTAATATGLGAGNYTVNILSACGATATVLVTITQPATLTVATNTKTNVTCNGLSNGSASVGLTGGTIPYSYAWSPSGGSSATATGLVAGTYTCTITDANSCSTTQSFTITEPTAIPAPTAAAQSFCNTATVANLSAVGTGIKWYATATAPTALAATSTLITGTYFATQTIGTCESASRTAVVVTATDCSIPYANLQFPGTSTIFGCNNETFYAQVYKLGVTEAAGPGTGITAWMAVSTSNTDPATWPSTAWQPATFNVQVGNNDEFQYTTTGLGTGTYYVASRFQFSTGPTVTGPFVYGGFSSGGGGAWNGTTNVNAVLTVITVPPPTAAATQAICNAGTVANLSATGTAIKWYSTATLGSALAATTTLAAGTYYASQTLASCESPVRTPVTVTLTSVSNGLSLNAGLLTASQTGATYAWYQCPNALIASATGQTYAPTVIGDYRVEVTVAGCTVLSNCITVSTLSNAAIKPQGELNIYPNPTSSQVTIELSDFENASLDVFDVNGRFIFSKQLNKASNQIDLDNLSQGVYLFKVNSNQGTTSRRVIKN